MRSTRNRFNSHVLIAVGLVVLVLLNCASPQMMTAPKNYYLPNPLEITESPTGAWAEVKGFKRSPSIMGELISISGDSIYVLSRSGLKTIATTDTRQLVLYTFKAETGKAASAGMLGPLSSLSHGYAMTLTTPLWLLVTIGTASRVSRIPRMEYPGEETLEEFHKFARFPAGFSKEIRNILVRSQA